jgi:hypothetical protein
MRSFRFEGQCNSALRRGALQPWSTTLPFPEHDSMSSDTPGFHHSR